jgi:hypothetical protein
VMRRFALARGCCTCRSEGGAERVGPKRQHGGHMDRYRSPGRSRLAGRIRTRPAHGSARARLTPPSRRARMRADMRGGEEGFRPRRVAGRAVDHLIVPDDSLAGPIGTEERRIEASWLSTGHHPLERPVPRCYQGDSARRPSPWT